MTHTTEYQPPVLAIPDDKGLPFLAYGSLRPGEPAHSQVARYVTSCSLASIPGKLFVRDGLPLLLLMAAPSHDVISAFLLTFRRSDQQLAYEAICRFEPGAHYEWATLQIDGGVRANLLVGRHPEEGSEAAEDLPWSGWSDPVFEHGLGAVRAMIAWSGLTPFRSAPPDSFEWERFFSLQMAYLLLWSAVERFCSLSYGPARNPIAKLRKLAAHRAMGETVRAHIRRTDTVLDVRDPTLQYRLDASSPEACLSYYYQVRNNLSHRGKGAWRDGEKVRLALVELTEVFCDFFTKCRSESTTQADAPLP